MVIGVCQVELHFPEGHSLKAKRQILSSLKSKLGRDFNLSVAEVGDHDLWQRAILGMACVANETRHVNRVLDQALNAIRSNPNLELLESRIELL
ncbi:DUF503 domain-containing protein [Candidatus Nitronereus thalassa]|uniref:DUF503 domain-containing protein n=1 Tax=Candidatus Nitronereus thalassa TaxID=3020898 RepID=A0ABU3K7E4_9BACT|nr:DUF503 domain-containing protein [Candidatus Nitronereus thalassa]MDT7042311.1 DUF503 domain-containing protein [Candidatus Nitronereus thalassa]